MSESAKSTKSNSIFTPCQVDRLGLINRFILRVTDKDIAADTAKLGDDHAEHEEGTNYYNIAAGHRVRFSHHVSSVIIDHVTSGGTETRAKMQTVDRFENRWHPRVRNAIRRFVVAGQREAFDFCGWAWFGSNATPEPEEPPIVRGSGLFSSESTDGSNRVNGHLEPVRGLLEQVVGRYRGPAAFDVVP